MRHFLGIFVSLLVASCAHLPPLTPVDANLAQRVTERCRRAFPTQPWRATHTIFATLPFGQNSEFIGVTATGVEGLRAILLSPEGLRLFDGVQRAAGGLRVQRAVPPFDRPDFAASLMADVGSAFLSPAGAPMAIGAYASGETVCRWSPLGGETTDVALGEGGPRAIRTYRATHATREILLVGEGSGGFFPLVVLRVPGPGGYELEMKLVDRE
jgi:hypothetical protein